MILENIGDVLKASAEQLVGAERLGDIDITKLQDVADLVENVFGENGKPLLMGKLMTRIYDVKVRERTYKGDSLNILKSNHEFGNILELVYNHEVENDEEASATLVKGASYDPFVFNPIGEDVYVVTGRYKYKSKVYSVTREDLDVAFTSMEELDKFLTNKVNMFDLLADKNEDAYARTITAQAIGLTIAKGQTSQVRHLLTEYNTEKFGSTTSSYVTKSDAGYNLWKKAKIDEIMRKARLTSTRYNIEGVSIEESSLGLKLGMVKKAVVDMDLAIATVYHNDASKLPEHQTVEAWQSLDNGDEESIKITQAFRGETVVTDATNVIGFIYDEAGLAITRIKRELRTQPQYLDNFLNYKAYGEFESVIVPCEIMIALLDN